VIKVTEKNEQEGIKALAEALRAGGILLNLSCPNCGYPIIEIDGRKYCKICDVEVITYKTESDLPKEYRKALHQNNQVESPMVKTLSAKIETLRKKLEKTNDPDEIIKISEAIDKLNKTLQNLEE
jgi:uncharacterized Zn finger protein (UPF0148 family)